MARRRRRPALVKRSCRRGCGRSIYGLSGPLHGTQADFDRYHGICDKCLTADEKADMEGAMLLRTARNIIGGLRQG